MDTIRTTLIRAIKKMPLILLKRLNSKADYKSAQLQAYTKAYEHTRSSLAMLMDHVGLKHSLHSSPLENFTSIYYPPPKVVACASDPEHAELIIKHRQPNSLKKLQKLVELTPVFSDLMALASTLVGDSSLRGTILHDQLLKLADVGRDCN